MISCVLWKVSWIIFGDGRLYPKQRKWHLTASKRWNYETTYLWMSGTSILWCWRLGVRNAIVLSVHANSDEWEKGSMRHWPHSRRKQSSLLPTADLLPNLISMGDGFRAGKLPRKTRAVCACSSCCAARFSPLRTDVPNKTCPLAIEWNAG